jgi:site-specific DNA recombinase
VSAARVRYGTTATSAAEVYGLGYARISGGKEQRDSALSIPAQDHHIRTAMARAGVVPLDSVSDILKGTRSDRPGYQRLLAMVRRLTAEGKQVAVFIFRLDRFGRDPEERSRAWKELAALGVRLYAIQSNGWVTERFLYDLDAALSQREVTLVGERVCAVNDFVRGNGFPKVGRPSWGYRVRPSTPEERAAGAGKAMIEPNPNEAEAVRRVWEMRARGDSLGDVHRWVMGLSERERGRRRLARATFARMFRAAVYVARLEYPAGHPLATVPVLDRPRGAWTALVDDDVYRRVAVQPEEHARRPKQASGHFLLTGVLRCHRCGARMTGRHKYAAQGSGDGRGPNVQQYGCIGHLGGAGVTAEQRACSTIVNAVTLDAWVMERVARALAVFDDPAARDGLTRAWDQLRRTSQQGDDLGGRVALAERRRDKWQQARASAFAAAAVGEITKAERDEVRQRAQGEIEDAERELVSARRALSDGADDVARVVLPPLATVLARLDGWERGLRAGAVAAQRVLLGELVERVEPVPVRRGVYRARIVWTARGRAVRRVGLGWQRAARLVGAGRVPVETLAWANSTTLTQSDAPAPPAPGPATPTPAPRPAPAPHARDPRPAGSSIRAAS